MFIVNQTYSKKDIYRLLEVPPERQKGAWDTGYREYEGNIYIFANVGVAGRTGHDYNNFFDGELFYWEGKTHSHSEQPIIRKMLNPTNEKVFLFTRVSDKDPFTYEGTVTKVSSYGQLPIKIVWTIDANDSELMVRDSQKLLYEGNPSVVLYTKYERDPVARRLCIDYYGWDCLACQFNFWKTYGDLGFNFIHVHHIIPLSSIQQTYRVNPIKDLVPLCPNCHSMVHRAPEALTVSDLRVILKNHRTH
jgi:5-methylcytosine-specific restriction enzyme A